MISTTRTTTPIRIKDSVRFCIGLLCLSPHGPPSWYVAVVRISPLYAPAYDFQVTDITATKEALEAWGLAYVLTFVVTTLCSWWYSSHANLSVTTQNCPFSVLGFWDKNTGICAGAMPYRRDFTATTRI